MVSQPELFARTSDDADIELRKHVGAVAVVPASRRITALARKVYNILLHLAQEQGEAEVYRVPLRQVVVLADYESSNNMAPFKQTLKQMVSTVVEWQSPSDGEIERWDACGLLASVAIEKHSSGAMVLEWSYAPAVRVHLLTPERYARISLEVVAQFRTHAAIVLYEICSRYIDNPSGLTGRHPWQWWRPVLSGNPEFRSKTKKAPEYRNFKRDVLKPAIAEINAIADIEVEGPLERKGPDNKTIVDVQFRVRRKPTAPGQGGKVERQGPSARPAPVDMVILNRAMAAGIRQSDAEELMDAFGETVFVEGLADLERRLSMPADKVAEVASPGRWLRTILPGKAKALEKAKAGVGEGGTTPTPAALLPDKRQAKWLDEWLRRRRETVSAEFGALPEESQGRFKAQFRERLVGTKSPLLKRYDADGWQHRMFIGKFLGLYAQATWGPGWDQPSAEQLLAIAIELG